MGVMLAALFAIGIAAGWLVDSLFDSSPLFTLIGLTLGLVAACWYAITEFRKYLKN